MGRSFDEALSDRPLFFEPVPPPARTNPARAQEQFAALRDLLAALPRIDAVNVPELAEENHDGRPRYRTEDPRLFARRIREATGREVLVNKIVAHLAGAAAMEEWARATVDAGVRRAVLVGGSSRYIPYPGPSVTEANRIAGPIFGAAGGSVGNIAIPQRENEAHRMLLKTRSGARFFTTQIVFDPQQTIAMLAEYGRLCRQASLPPASVLVSLAPIADEGDAEFVRWLGADIPDAVERELLNGDESSIGRRSAAHALSVWTAIRDAPSLRPLGRRVGLNVEQITTRHLATARAMIELLLPEIEGSDRGSAAPDPVA